MARMEVITAVRARLAANWSAAPVYDNNSQGSTPEDASPFVILQFPLANTERWPVNQRYYVEEGAFRVVIHTQRGSGEDLALQWSDQIADIFRDQTFAGVECKVPSSPLLDDENDQGPYFATSLVVPYVYRYTD